MPGLLFFLLCLLPSWLFAQDPAVRRIGKEQGLPTKTIYNLMQDHQGFLWLGTDRGLYKYDGLNFTRYENKAQAGRSLTNLYQDNKQRIWCQNFVGQFFYFENDSLHLFEAHTASGNYFPFALLNHNFLIGKDAQSFFSVNLHTLERRTLKPTRDDLTSPFIQIYDQKYWYLSSKELVALDQNGEIKRNINLQTESSHFYFFFYNDQIWMLAKNNAKKINIFSLDGHFVRSVPLESSIFIQNICQLDQETFAICTPSGLILLRPKDAQTTVKTTAWFKGINCANAMLDQQGNLWIGTINNSLLMVAKQDILLWGQGYFFTRCFYDHAQKRLLAATSDNKLFQIDMRSKQLKLLFSGTANMEASALSYDQNRDLIMLASDNMYYISADKIINEDIAVKDIYIGNDHKYYMAVTGYMRVDELVNKGKRSNKVHNSLRNRCITVNEKASQILLATSKGISVYDAKSLEKITDLPEMDQVLFESFAMYKDTLFAASSNDGIYAIYNNKVAYRLTTTHGLSKKSIFKVKVQGSELWWMCENSIQMMSLEDRKIYTFSHATGLIDAEIKDFDLSDHYLFIASSQGILQVPISTMRKASAQSPKLLCHLYANGQQYSIEREETFSYNQSNIDINYWILSYRNKYDLAVLYRINEQAWIPLDPKQNTLRLSNLAHGKYKVQVKVLDLAIPEKEANTENNAATFSFQISAPFWLSYWFIGLCIGCLLFMAWLIYRSRMKKINKQNALAAQKLQLEQQLQKSLLTSIKSQMNPHFIFNALNTIQSYIYLNEKHQASRYLVKFSELTRQILEMSNSDTVLLSQEIKTITLYLELEKMRFEDSLQYEIRLDPQIMTDQLSIPSMLIQPYIENAIKHGLMHKKDNRNVLVDFSLQAHYLQIKIDDDGVGRSKSAQINAQRQQKHNSFATNANLKRIELLNIGQKHPIDFQVIDKIDAQNRPAGTCVLLKIPIENCKKIYNDDQSNNH